MGIITGSVDKHAGRDAALGCPLFYTWRIPGAADDDRVVVAEAPALAFGATKELTLAANPDWVRPLTYEVSVDASGDLRMQFDTYGSDFWGNRRHERVTNVTLAGGAALGNVAWRAVVKIVATTLGAGADAGDRVIVGMNGTHFGLPVMVGAPADVLSARVDFNDPLTRVPASPAPGEYAVLVGPHFSNIEFGDAANGASDYQVEVMSSHGVQFR